MLAMKNNDAQLAATPDLGSSAAKNVHRRGGPKSNDSLINSS